MAEKRYFEVASSVVEDELRDLKFDQSIGPALRDAICWLAVAEEVRALREAMKPSQKAIDEAYWRQRRELLRVKLPPGVVGADKPEPELEWGQ